MPEWKPELFRRLAALKLDPTREAEIVDELSQHLEDRYQELLSGGQTRESAQHAALEELRDEDLLARNLRPVERQLHRDPIAAGSGAPKVFGGILQDIGYALRMLYKSPGFAAVAILTLALGIGANAAIFRLIDAVQLRTLPVKDPQTLAIVHVDNGNWRFGRSIGPYSEFTYPLWQEVERRQQAFSTIAAWGGGSHFSVNLAPGGEVDLAHYILVSGDFFKTLGVEPFAGRLISGADDQTGCEGGVVLSYAFWQRRYGGAASAIGKTIALDGHPFIILGVTPPSFYGVAIGEQFDVALPICAEPILNGEFSRIRGKGARESWCLSVFGRLKPGWTLKRATAQLKAMAPAALKETIPAQYDAEGVKHYLAYDFEARAAATGFSALRQDNSTWLQLLLGLSGLVLLIACANLANLLLARASSREREMAVRLALGASRGRLMGQLFGESALLAMAGTIAGGVLAAGLSRALVAFISTPNDPIILDMATDWRVVGFAAGLAALTTILFGLAPAIRAGRTPPGSVLKTGGRGTTTGRERFRLQRILVASQVALSLALLMGALLFARSLRNLMTRDPGFQENGVLAADVDYSRLKLPDAQQIPFERELLERVRAIPGVAAAATADRSPMGWNSSDDPVLDKSGATKRGIGEESWVSPGYFATVEEPILAGRDFDSNDTATSPPVAVVNQTFVKRFLDGAQNPVGKQFRMWTPPGQPPRMYRVVGEVRDSVYLDLHDPMLPVTYFPRTQLPNEGAEAMFLVRSKTGGNGLAKEFNDAMTSVNPKIEISSTMLKTQVRNSVLQDELMATLCGFFGVLAVLLAAIGLYGVIAYTVSQRTNEIGIRMALGAQRAGVIRLILGEVSLVVGVGIAAGAGLALAGGKAAGSLLYGLKAHDPLTLALAIIFLAAVAIGASFVPARRASRLDPVVALRNE